MLSKSDQVLLMTPDGPWNPHKIAYSKMEDVILDFEGNLVEKRKESE